MWVQICVWCDVLVCIYELLICYYVQRACAFCLFFFDALVCFYLLELLQERRAFARDELRPPGIYFVGESILFF